VNGLTAARLSGLGVLDPAPDDALYDKYFVHADVLVVGGGPAGLAAALSAAQSDARVVLIDEQSELGGSLLASQYEKVNGRPAPDWVAAAAEALATAPEVTVLTRTVAFGSYDGNYVIAVQTRTDHLDESAPLGVSRQRVWHIRARQVVLATGAHERPLVFSGNDRPGVMLAGAVRTYINRYAVKPGNRAVVATTNDSAYDAVDALLAAGVNVVAVLDARDVLSKRAAEMAARGFRVIPSATVQGTDGDADSGRVTRVQVATIDDNDEVTCWESVDCDLLAVSGGLEPGGPPAQSARRPAALGRPAGRVRARRRRAGPAGRRCGCRRRHAG
jgi:sarcosine oxidase subunit alpha